MAETAVEAVDTAAEESVLITAKAGSGDVTAEASWNPGATIEEALDLYGEEIVFGYFKAHGTRNLQNSIRSILAGGGDQAKVTETLKDWKPGVTRRATADPVGKFIKAFGNMDEAQQAEMLQRLQAQLKAGDESAE